MFKYSACTGTALLALILLACMADAFSGDGTYYDVGLGACGRYNNDGELVAAVSQGVYGYQSNPNNAPICHKCALVKYHGKSVKVRIVDKCMGCKHDDIDLSPTAFKRLANQRLGRIKVNWNFVSC